MALRQINRRWVMTSIMLAGLTMLTLGGCTGSEDEVTGPVAVLATYTPEGEGGDGALLEGVVHVAGDSGCVTVGNEFGEVTTPVFPESQVRPQALSFIYRDRVYRDGDAISLVGGELALDAASPYLTAECQTKTAWMVAQ